MLWDAVSIETKSNPSSKVKKNEGRKKMFNKSRKGMAIWLSILIGLGVVSLIVGSWNLFSALTDKADAETFAMKNQKSQSDTDNNAPPDTYSTCDKTQVMSVIGKALHWKSGTTADVNSEIYNKDNGVVTGETRVNGATTLSTNVPMYFSGYIMVGNDNFQSTTDRGAEYYYMKRDISYGCIGSTSEKDFKLYNESLITWDFYRSEERRVGKECRS